VYEFETVRLNERGRVVERRRAEAHYFSEDLGGGVELDMMAIPGGSFLMGSPEGQDFTESDEHPQHTVIVQPFYMGKFEVTQAQWKAIIGNNPSSFKGDDLPVDNVSWYEAMEFCDRLSRATGRLYRLPTEAEWEYACRAGTRTPFAFGETITPDIVNYSGNAPYLLAPKGIYRQRPIPVGSLGVANGFGLYDTHANLREWCIDPFHDSYIGAPTDGSAWEGGDAKLRITRGGAWVNVAAVCTTTRRFWCVPENGYKLTGFRVVAVVGNK
jgi:formylglycine-generating enzyme required for sulfatase activity